MSNLPQPVYSSCCYLDRYFQTPPTINKHEIKRLWSWIWYFEGEYCEVCVAKVAWDIVFKNHRSCVMLLILTIYLN